MNYTNDNAFTMSLLDLHMIPIYENRNKTTLLCAEPKLCSTVPWSLGLSVHTENWDKLCETALAFSCPLLKMGYEIFCEQVCECMCVVVEECVCRKSKILQHHSLQLVVYWKQARRAPTPQVDQPLPRYCEKLGGVCLSPELSAQSLDYQSNFLFSCKYHK